MNARLLTTLSPAPRGLPGRRRSPSGNCCPAASSCWSATLAEVAGAIPDFAARVRGFVVELADAYRWRPLGPALWHLTLPGGRPRPRRRPVRGAARGARRRHQRRRARPGARHRPRARAGRPGRDAPRLQRVGGPPRRSHGRGREPEREPPRIGGTVPGAGGDVERLDLGDGRRRRLHLQQPAQSTACWATNPRRWSAAGRASSRRRGDADGCALVLARIRARPSSHLRPREACCATATAGW